MAVTLALGCGDGGSQAARPAPPPVAPAAAEAKRTERPLPAFEGTTLGGERIAMSSLLGKRVVLFLFNPEVADAKIGAKALAGLTRIQGAENFTILGIAAGSDRRTLEAFVREQGIDYPVIDDPSAAISRKLGIPVPVAMIGADSQGYILFGLGQFPKEGPDPAGSIEAYVRSALRLPATAAPVEMSLGERPLAPSFTAQRLDGGAPFELASLRGKPVILVFFLHSCPHCHHELEFLKKELPKIPESARPVLIGVSMLDHVASVKATLEQDGLDYFPVLLDADYKIRTAYGALAGVPDTFLIDAKGRVVSRTNGWGNPQDEPLMRMRLAKLAGQPVPMLLSATGYSGNEFCAVCHEGPSETWELTAHAGAFATLVRHGADKDTECVGCHVVGWGEPGGYTVTPATPQLENVGCEDCHGRGGPHQSPEFVKNGDFAPACATCHNEKHSLGFSYSAFVPLVGCSSIAHLAELPLAEKRKLMEANGRLREPILGNANARFVGSAACQSCHASEYAIWEKSPHAHSIRSLEADQKTGQQACLKCHVTGYGRPGGFPTGGTVAENSGLTSVGCEDCHGPGSDHVAEGAEKRGTIVGLGDKCKTCAILQVCGACHDDANDPGFRFELEAKIEQQRHGTAESAAEGRNAAGSAFMGFHSREEKQDPLALAATLEQALRLDGSGR